jgi:hypothetical protein
LYPILLFIKQKKIALNECLHLLLMTMNEFHTVGSDKVDMMASTVSRILLYELASHTQLPLR